MYTGQRQNRSFFGSHLIEPRSVEEQLSADLMEQGKGYKKTTDFMNKIAKQEDKPIVGRTAVRDAYLCLNPVKLKIAKKPQGSNNANSNWAKASFT
mmetsp:Transcript_52967/g.53395  ORF Transcript_52967/g.53395 Transcript_52967/m.53395 type:complete len:96 (+) Transcript_52967:556-843(+)